MTASPRGPLMQKLREATAIQHRAVETLLPPFGDLSREGYAEYLTTMAGFHVPLEEQLFSSHDWAARGLSDAPERRRTPLIEDDLERLGIDHTRVRRCGGLPDVSAFGRALGALYVLEGSKLGGLVIAREVKATLADVPTSFLYGAGAQTGAQWVAFRAFAESKAAENVPLGDEAAQAAVETFEALRGWLRRT